MVDANALQVLEDETAPRLCVPMAAPTRVIALMVHATATMALVEWTVLSSDVQTTVQETVCVKKESASALKILMEMTAATPLVPMPVQTMECASKECVTAKEAFVVTTARPGRV